MFLLLLSKLEKLFSNFSFSSRLDFSAVYIVQRQILKVVDNWSIISSALATLIIDRDDSLNQTADYIPLRRRMTRSG